MSRRGSRAAWGSALAGLASTASLPVAIYATRFSASYELLQAGFAIPLAAGLGFFALVLSRKSRRGASLLAGTSDERRRVADAGRALGIVGICMAASALVALGVYGLLEYVGSRD